MKKEITLGRHSLGPGAVLAPMAGITNPPFRQLCIELGASLTVTELVSCHALVYLDTKSKNRGRKRGVKTLAQIEKFPGEYPFAVQLYGREPEMLAHAAKIVEREGADVIDLNFGCPARKVIKDGQGCGVALMLDPPLVEQIVSAVVEAVSVPVTAKTRTGWSASKKNAVEIAKRIENGGAQMICIHGRTRDQGHSGEVDYETVRAVVESVNLPVVGNGGITGPEEATLMKRKTGCARVAVGQGAKGNPWIFRELIGGPGAPRLAERVATCRRHLELYMNWTGEARSVLEMRKHACWYLKGFSGAAAFRKRLGEAVSADAFNALLDELQV